MLTNNYYTNPNSKHTCFPKKIKLKCDEDNHIDVDLITVNNLFAHLVKEISMRRYGNDKHLMPSFSPYEIYQYLDSMLRHLSKNALKKIQKAMLNSKAPVYFNRTTLEGAITKLQNQLKSDFFYRITLCYFTDIGKINFPLMIDFRIKCHLKTVIKRLFDSKKSNGKGTAFSLRTVFS